jgi:hypothetical protein
MDSIRGGIHNDCGTSITQPLLLKTSGPNQLDAILRGGSSITIHGLALHFAGIDIFTHTLDLAACDSHWDVLSAGKRAVADEAAKLRFALETQTRLETLRYPCSVDAEASAAFLTTDAALIRRPHVSVCIGDPGTASDVVVGTFGRRVDAEHEL